jgi:hypothetical protein
MNLRKMIGISADSLVTSTCLHPRTSTCTYSDYYYYWPNTCTQSSQCRAYDGLQRALPLHEHRKNSVGRGLVPDDTIETTSSLHLTPSSAFPGSSLLPDGINNIRTIDDQLEAEV